MRDRRSLPIRLFVSITIALVLFGFWSADVSAWSINEKEGIIYYPRIDGAGYLALDPPPKTARVITKQGQQDVIIGDNTILYIDAGSRQGIQVGDQLLVYSILNPRELDPKYRVISIDGRLRVIEVAPFECAGRVEEAYKSISFGAYIMPYEPLDATIPLKPAPNLMNGRILWSYGGESSFGEGDLALLNKGVVDGVEPGHCFRVFRIPMDGYGGSRTAGQHLTYQVGELIVIRTQPTTSTALVTQGLFPLAIGERFGPGCRWEEELMGEEAVSAGKEVPSAKGLPSQPSGVPGAGRPKPAKGPSLIRGLRNVHFSFDSYALDERARGVLESNAVYLKENSQMHVIIEGHCDERGTDLYNLALGDRRADAAKRYLIELGIDKSRMETISYGEEKPLDPGHNEVAWAKNRRAQFVKAAP